MNLWRHGRVIVELVSPWSPILMLHWADLNHTILQIIVVMIVLVGQSRQGTLKSILRVKMFSWFGNLRDHGCAVLDPFSLFLKDWPVALHLCTHILLQMFLLGVGWVHLFVGCIGCCLQGVLTEADGEVLGQTYLWNAICVILVLSILFLLFIRQKLACIQRFIYGKLARIEGSCRLN